MMWRTLFVLLLALSAVRADDDILRALQARVTKARRENGPSVVCIYVSRSDSYQKARYWGVSLDPERPDRLGRFSAAEAGKKVPEDSPRRARILRDIAEHDLSDPNHIPESYGSGFVVDKSGLILTCAHVVKNATKVYVRLSDKKGSWADIQAYDLRSDLAVLRLLDPPEGLKALTFGDGGTVRFGQFVLSLCNSFAPGFRGDDAPVIGSGYITALRRSPPGEKTNERDLVRATLHHYGTLLQTDAAATPGCSGGALLDLDGKVIGLTTALAGVGGDRPGGFAIPLDLPTQRIIDVLKRGEEVEYGFLGVILSESRDGFEAKSGVRLFRVAPGSPAARAGLQANDVVITINDKPVRKKSDLFLHVGMGLNGRKANIEVRRGFGTRKVEVTLAKFYIPGPVMASKRPPARFGLRIDHASILSQRNAFFASMREMPPGVVIREVMPDSPADKANLQPDKYITRVNGRVVASPEEYRLAIIRAGKSVRLTLLNSEGKPFDLTLNEK